MAITVNGTIATARVNESNAPTITLTGVQTGEGVVLLFSLDAADTITSVTISGESNATQIGTVWTPGGNFSTDSEYSYIFPSIAGSSGDKVITINRATTADTSMRALRISGHNTSSPVGNINTGSGSTTNGSISLTTTVDNSMIIGTMKCESTITVGSGYTEITATNPFWNWEMLRQYDADVGTAGSKTVPFVNAGADPWNIRAFEIKAAAASGPAKPILAAYRAQQ